MARGPSNCRSCLGRGRCEFNARFIFLVDVLSGLRYTFPTSLGAKFQEAIETFRTSAELNVSLRCFSLSAHFLPQILLMPSRFGANGLTLIEATQVIILAPFVNPAVEAQAISRVNRIGQTKPTTVHKLLIAPSIEEKLSELAARKRATCVLLHCYLVLAADVLRSLPAVWTSPNCERRRSSLCRKSTGSSKTARREVQRLLPMYSIFPMR
jgi:hypothetical protein